MTLRHRRGILQELGWPVYLGDQRHDAAAQESLNPERIDDAFDEGCGEAQSDPAYAATARSARRPPPTVRARPGTQPNSTPTYTRPELPVCGAVVVQATSTHSYVVRRTASGRRATPNHCTGLYLTEPRIEPGLSWSAATGVPTATSSERPSPNQRR